MRLVVDKVNYGSSLFPANYKGLAGMALSS